MVGVSRALGHETAAGKLGKIGIGQVILGERKFVESLEGKLREGQVRTIDAATATARPKWQEIVIAVEAMRRERWEQFQNRQGDWRRNVTMYPGCQPGITGRTETALRMDYFRALENPLIEVTNCTPKTLS